LKSGGWWVVHRGQGTFTECHSLEKWLEGRKKTNTGGDNDITLEKESGARNGVRGRRGMGGIS